MPTYPLPYRIHDFLNRQIAWSRAVLDELDAFCALPDDGDFDEAAARQRKREKEMPAMAREYNGLLQEWNRADDISPEIREAITRHSEEARKLAEEVRDRYAAAEVTASQRKLRNRESLNDLRRGRRSVNIYTPGLLESPGFIDREA